MSLPMLRAPRALSGAALHAESHAGAHADFCSSAGRVVAQGTFARFATTLALTGALIASLVASPAVDAKTAQPKPVLDAAAVATPDRYAADAAQQIFAAGGNAVDAAVAIAFTLAVTYPDAGNIGGGGFMTLVMDGKPYFLDYREKAPQ
ncbi:MAG: gamma-glutamyltransferase, partial [Paraburkholderia hospita]